jgi:4-amino-4-deoxy-L-arabinose transferase-like glycosyltransferase
VLTTLPAFRTRLRRWPAPILTLAAIVFLGAALRLVGLHALPPGLYHDEAIEGTDAVRILHGEFPIYFETNNGREPAFMYLLAIGIAGIGWSPFTLRLVSALAGTVSIPIAYQAIRQVLNRRLGLLAAFVYAITFWPIEVTRLGLRSSLLPAALGLGIWGLSRAWRRDRLRDWLLAGCLYAASLYTYLPARLALLVPGVVAAVGLLERGRRRKLLRGGAVFALAYSLAALPLGLYALTHWDIFNGRVGQVSVFQPGAGAAHLAQVAWDQLRLVAQMFLLRGDTQLRHNLPGRPVFDWLMGIAFGAGLLVGIRRWRERRIQWLWIWVGVFLVPTLLADSAPHYLRAYGVWPILAAWPALGIDALHHFVQRRAGRFASLPLVAAILAGSLLATVHDYFWGDYLTSPAAYYAFDTFAAQFGADVNAFIGWGAHEPGFAWDMPPGEVWIDTRLYYFHPTIPVMIATAPSPAGPVHLMEAGVVPAPLAPPRVRLIIIPGEEGLYVAILPRRSLISLRDGSYANDTAEIHPYLLYRALTAIPADGLPAPIACFEHDIQLLPPITRREPNALDIDLAWKLRSSTAVGELPAYTVFLHVYHEGGLVGQVDSYPARGLFPFTWLRPGDVIQDPRQVRFEPGTFSGEGQIGVGLYERATGQRLQADDCAGQPLGDEVFVPVAP